MCMGFWNPVWTQPSSFLVVPPLPSSGGGPTPSPSSRANRKNWLSPSTSHKSTANPKKVVASSALTSTDKQAPASTLPSACKKKPFKPPRPSKNVSSGNSLNVCTRVSVLNGSSRSGQSTRASPSPRSTSISDCFDETAPKGKLYPSAPRCDTSTSFTSTDAKLGNAGTAVTTESSGNRVLTSIWKVPGSSAKCSSCIVVDAFHSKSSCTTPPGPPDLMWTSTFLRLWD
mmetsp:Transcript_3662/g.8119  ORF Transcript_3662/g.8119 Transcript_3662/m.8119 type:complete len:229 (+) Transcript_3662:18-704(+)